MDGPAVQEVAHLGGAVLAHPGLLCWLRFMNSLISVQYSVIRTMVTVRPLTVPISSLMVNTSRRA